MTNWQDKLPTDNSIQAMFDTIAPTYDRTNFFASWGLHLLWNRRLINKIQPCTHIIDLCAGTGTVGLSHLKNNLQSTAVLVDFSQNMLSIAQKRGMAFGNRLQICVAPAEKIPFANKSFDGATIAYGIRNIANRSEVFSEIARLLKPNGKLVILELTRPPNKIIGFPHSFYLKHLLPQIGKLCSGNKAAYEYLSKSILQFLSPTAVQTELHAAGFRSIKITPLSCGIATLFESTVYSRLSLDDNFEPRSVL